MMASVTLEDAMQYDAAWFRALLAKLANEAGTDWYKKITEQASDDQLNLLREAIEREQKKRSGDENE